MAQVDFDFNANVEGGSALLGGNDGTARLNSSLSGPLTGEAAYCREFFNPTTGNIAMVATLKASVGAGAFFEIPSTKSISVRAWIRHTDVSVGTYAIGIGAKLHAGAPDTNQNAPNGYSIMIGDTQQTGSSSRLRFIADSGATTTALANTSFTALDNTWHKVRLDVIPVGTAEDIINVYTGAGATGSEVWTLVYTRSILNSQPYYIPWAQTGDGKVGFWTMHDSNAHTFHIDRFQVFLEDV